MGTLAVRVAGLGKRYRLGAGVQPGSLLSERLSRAFRRPFRGWRGGTVEPAEFWALSDVAFDVAWGDTVGIVGRNGAGKSTLLKVLARITSPSSGRVELYGRTGALLEVGTGFHPELTGRENVYLNGAILGMGRTEIARKFDEIVAFAELEPFIDTPVKRYSSGMAVRLAFAVAAHLEPEILIVDEVLAVGDVTFQRRCLGKMDSVAREGRTVLFVSHDLAAVQALCRRAVFLHEGRVRNVGPVREVVNDYLASSSADRQAALDRPLPLGGGVSLSAFGFPGGALASGAPVRFEAEVVADSDVRLDELAVIVNDALGRRVAVLDLRQGNHVLRCGPGKPLGLGVDIDALPLVEGEYRVGLFIKGDHLEELRMDIVTLDIAARDAQAFVPIRAELRGVLDLTYEVSPLTGPVDRPVRSQVS